MDVDVLYDDILVLVADKGVGQIKLIKKFKVSGSHYGHGTLQGGRFSSRCAYIDAHCMGARADQPPVQGQPPATVEGTGCRKLRKGSLHIAPFRTTRDIASSYPVDEELDAADLDASLSGKSPPPDDGYARGCLSVLRVFQNGLDRSAR